MPARIGRAHAIAARRAGEPAGFLARDGVLSAGPAALLTVGETGTTPSAMRFRHHRPSEDRPPTAPDNCADPCLARWAAIGATAAAHVPPMINVRARRRVRTARSRSSGGKHARKYPSREAHVGAPLLDVLASLHLNAATTTGSETATAPSAEASRERVQLSCAGEAGRSTTRCRRFLLPPFRFPLPEFQRNEPPSYRSRLQSLPGSSCFQA